MGRGTAARLFVAAALAAPVVSFGQVGGTWINPNPGTWTNPANWSSNPQFPDGGGAVVLPSSTWNATTITLNTSLTLSRIDFDGPSRYFITSGGTITLTGPAIIDAEEMEGLAPDSSLHPSTSAMHVINGPIAGSAGLVKSGSGHLNLRGTIAYTGGTTINGGTLSFFAPSGLVGDYMPTIGPLAINGGALSYVSAFSSIPRLVLGQPIQVGPAGATISTYSDRGVTVNAGIDGSSALLFTSTSGESAEFVLSAPSNFSGTVTVDGLLRLTNAAVLGSVTSLTPHGGLSLDNRDTFSIAIADRVNDAAPIYLRGGGISNTGPADPPTIEQLGNVTLEAGSNRIGSFGLAINQLIRTQGTTVQFSSRGTSPGTQITGTLPALSGSGAVGSPDRGILPWASIRTTLPSEGLRPVTIENGYFRELTDSEFVDSVPSGVTNLNLRVKNADATISAPVTVNSLTIRSRTVSGTEILSISSGAIFADTTLDDVSIQVPIDFGTAEGIVHMSPAFPPPGDVSITGPISGSGGLTLSGSLSLSGQSTYTGPTTVLGSVRVGSNVIAGQPGPFGSDTSPIVVVAGNESAETIFGSRLILPGGVTPLQFDRNLDMRSEGPYPTSLVIGGSQTQSVVVSGDITVSGEMVVSGTLIGTRLNLTGDISGNGRVTDTIGTSGYLQIAGNNSFTGGFELQNGTLELGSDTALGSGTFWISGSPRILATGGARSLSNPVIWNASVTVAGSNDLTLSGPINLFGGTKAVTVTNSGLTRFTGQIYNGNLTKAGTGVLEISNARMPTLTVSAGQLRIAANGTPTGTSKVNTLSIAAGASFDLTNNALVIDYTGSTPAATVLQMLQDGRLFSSAGDFLNGLGYGENSNLGFTTFSGQQVDSTSILVKYTYKGDADLDGDVDSADLGRVGLSWLGAGGWTEGDFNYNGIVDVLDMYLLAQNWGAGVPGFLGQSLYDAIGQTGVPSSAVPEPNLTSLLLACLIPLRRRVRGKMKGRSPDGL